MIFVCFFCFKNQIQHVFDDIYLFMCLNVFIFITGDTGHQVFFPWSSIKDFFFFWWLILSPCKIFVISATLFPKSFSAMTFFSSLVQRYSKLRKYLRSYQLSQVAQQDSLAVLFSGIIRLFSDRLKVVLKFTLKCKLWHNIKKELQKIWQSTF